MVTPAADLCGHFHDGTALFTAVRTPASLNALNLNTQKPARRPELNVARGNHRFSGAMLMGTTAGFILHATSLTGKFINARLARPTLDAIRPADCREWRPGSACPCHCAC